jgi:hypothetical protein
MSTTNTTSDNVEQATGAAVPAAEEPKNTAEEGAVEGTGEAVVNGDAGGAAESAAKKKRNRRKKKKASAGEEGDESAEDASAASAPAAATSGTTQCIEEAS